MKINGIGGNIWEITVQNFGVFHSSLTNGSVFLWDDAVSMGNHRAVFLRPLNSWRWWPNVP